MPLEGTKNLTPSNWLEPDPPSLLCPRLKFADVEIATPPWPQRLDIVLRPRLLETVPSDIVALFETAQGAIAYGYFFYPLYTIGAFHLYRALEAAFAVRARAEGFAAKRAGLGKTLDWLMSKGVLSASARESLEPLRKLRKEASHPDFQSLITPGMTIALLDDIAGEINTLFGTAIDGRRATE